MDREKEGFAFDVVLGPATASGVTDNGAAVCLECDGMIRDIPGKYTVGVITASVPLLVASLVAHAGEAQTLPDVLLHIELPRAAAHSLLAQLSKALAS